MELNGGKTRNHGTTVSRDRLRRWRDFQRNQKENQKKNIQTKYKKIIGKARRNEKSVNGPSLSEETKYIIFKILTRYFVALK